MDYVVRDAQGDQNVDTRRTLSTFAKLHHLFAAGATSHCTTCMMLPCICPEEDGDTVLNDDEIASEEAACALTSENGQLNPSEETDEYGRVRLVESCRDVWIAREIKPVLKPHQVEGVQFMHSHVTANRGCILADYMGLGKTLQVITVIHSFIVDNIAARKQQSKRPVIRSSISIKSKKTEDLENSNDNKELAVKVLVLCPAICLSNWNSEFQKWLKIETRALCPILSFDSSTTKGTVAGRLRLLQRWKRTGGVLLMGYEMFRGILNPTTVPASCVSETDASIRVCSRLASATMEITTAYAQQSAQVQRTAHEFRRLLYAPGADLVVMDEGHRMKDPSSLLCQSVTQIQTSRRLVLTGYPVQNSLSEYWCMVNFARESLLGSYDDFRVNYERPILEGNTTRSQELVELLQNVVLRRGPALLRSQLPPKKEWILYCKLSPVQHRLYCDFLDSFSDDNSATADLLTAYAALLQVMNHPDIIYAKLCPSEEDSSEVVLQGNNDFNNAMPTSDDSSGWEWESEERQEVRKQTAAARMRKKRQKLTDIRNSSEWARSALFGGSRQATSASADDMTNIYRTLVPENSGKMVVLLRIVEESLACGDKVVVFSQSVPTLRVISDFLRAKSFGLSQVASKKSLCFKKKGSTKSKRHKITSRSNRDPAGISRKLARTSSSSIEIINNVISNEWFLQIDGGTNGAKRIEYIQRFSSAGSPVKLLLVSTRAGAEGINLHAANRLVLFDVSWNPSNDHQSMCRSHRIGQVKTVHVYRLVSTGTMERMIFEQQMKKIDLSTAVLDSHKIDQGTSAADSLKRAVKTVGVEKKEAHSIAFSGFLQPPSEADYDVRVAVDRTTLDEDTVLASCVKHSGQWIADIHPAHEYHDDEKQIAKT
ncbi:hypothetical protein PsorP6_008627 [Peronosclerospora sorghi]|uniref:Uncharacterized protein n=1 Tax=Peronosclerospora sorghi TaxID=230839 RepID=A0ACC0WAU9_9STRA|nr:hypothetical protein PsorP6_008627 [Peronosclerospora sorghi]